MTELNSLKFYPITTTLGPKAEKEGKGKISSPASVSYEEKKKTKTKTGKQKAYAVFPIRLLREGNMFAYGNKEERRENV